MPFAAFSQWHFLIPSDTLNLLPTMTTIDTVQQNLESGRALQYSIYRLEFTIDWDINNPDVVAADELAGRLRRIAVDGGDEVESDVIVLDWMIKYKVDKVFKQD